MVDTQDEMCLIIPALPMFLHTFQAPSVCLENCSNDLQDTPKLYGLISIKSYIFWQDRLQPTPYPLPYHTKENKAIRYSSPLIETHLAVVRGLPTKKFLPECVNEKSSAKVVRPTDLLQNVRY